MTETSIKPDPFFRETFPVGPLGCNCSIIADTLSKKAMVIDPGGDAEKIIARIQELNFTTVALICTHAHFDHFLAAGQLHEVTGAPVYLHKDDRFLWDSLDIQCQMFGVPYQPVPAPHRWLVDEQILPCCNGIALHTPGHSPGSTSFWFEQEKVLIAGDTLFKGSVGRTDIWGGNFQQIEASIREKLYTLDDDALVITGHGKSTYIGEEKTTNAIIRV